MTVLQVICVISLVFFVVCLVGSIIVSKFFKR